jgi:hypothetical protein
MLGNRAENDDVAQAILPRLAASARSASFCHHLFFSSTMSPRHSA